MSSLCVLKFLLFPDCLNEKTEITNKTKPKVIDICLGSGEKAKITGVKWSPNGHMLAASTGKSLSEAPILASTNPQYDKRLFIELQVLCGRHVIRKAI